MMVGGDITLGVLTQYIYTPEIDHFCEDHLPYLTKCMDHFCEDICLELTTCMVWCAL